MKKVMNNNKKTFSGVVKSVKMDRTIVVEVTRQKLHPIYMKKYVTSHKFKVDSNDEKYEIGQLVKFCETRPISKEKHFKVVK